MATVKGGGAWLWGTLRDGSFSFMVQVTGLLLVSKSVIGPDAIEGDCINSERYVILLGELKIELRILG